MRVWGARYTLGTRYLSKIRYLLWVCSVVELLAHLMDLLTFSMFCVLTFGVLASSICMHCLLVQNAYEYLIVISLST